MKGEVVHCEDGRIVRDLGIDIISVFVPFDLTKGRRKPVRKVIPPADTGEEQAPTPLQVAVAKAHVWQRWLDEGEAKDSEELAARERVDRWTVNNTLRLTNLAPFIVEGILNGEIGKGVTLEDLRGEIPILWHEQEAFFAKFEAGSKR